MSALQALNRRFPDWEPAVVFDVGANVGQSVEDFGNHYPNTRIFAFEPIEKTFEALRSRVEGNDKVSTHRLAFSRRAGTMWMEAKGTSTMNRVVPQESKNAVSVEVQSGDAFCAQHGVSDIGYLKIDTEGHDVDVVVGFSGMLRDHRIEFIQVECSFSPHNTFHVEYSRLAALLHSFDYGLLGFFNLRPYLGRYRRRGMLFGDAVFLRDEVIHP